MGLFNRKKEDKSDVATPDVKSDDSTPVQSGAASLQEKDNAEDKAVESGAISDAQSPEREATDDNAAEKKIEAIEEEADEEDDEAKDYPKSMKLILITVALCLSGRKVSTVVCACSIH